MDRNKTLNGDSLRRNKYPKHPQHGKRKIVRADESSVSAPKNIPSGTDLTAARDRLRAKASQSNDDNPPQSWRPNVGGELFGRLTAVETRRTKQSDAERVAILETESGERVAAWLFYRVLGDEWDQAQPSIGELVLLERLPDGVSKGHGGQYRRYRVTVDWPDEAAPDPAQGDWTLAEGGAK